MMRLGLVLAMFLFAACADERHRLKETVSPRPTSSSSEEGHPRAGGEPQQVPMQTDARIDLTTKDVGAQVKALRDKVKSSNGRFVSDTTEGYGDGLTSASFRIRIPESSFDEMIDFIRSLGKVAYQHIARRSLVEGFEEEAANQPQRNGEKLPKKRPKGSMESEIDVRLTKEIVSTPDAHSLVGGHYSNLQFNQRINGRNSRYGGGVALTHPSRFASLELSAYKSYENEGASSLATIGFSSYSSLLGNGRNRFFNPVMGVRFGLLGIDNVVSWVIGLDLSVEILKYQQMVLEGFGRPYAILGEKHSGNVIESGVRFYYPF